MRKTALLCFLSVILATGAMADSKETVTVNGTVVGKQATRMTFNGDNVTLLYSDGTSQSAEITTVNVAFDYVAKFKDSSYDNLATIKTFGGQTMTAEVTRGMEAGQWAPLCLPFTIAETDIATIFGSGTLVATLDEVSATAINFATVSEIKAGVPYIIKPTKKIENFTVSNVLIGTMGEGSTASTDSGELSGTINAIAPTGNIYYLGTGNVLKPLAEGSQVSPLRAYLRTPSAISGGGRLLGDVNNDGTVSITDITIVVNSILGIESVEASLADFNGDNELSILDVDNMVNIILSNEGESQSANISILLDGEPSDITFSSSQGNGTDQASNSTTLWE